MLIVWQNFPKLHFFSFPRLRVVTEQICEIDSLRMFEKVKKKNNNMLHDSKFWGGCYLKLMFIEWYTENMDIFACVNVRAMPPFWHMHGL